VLASFRESGSPALGGRTFEEVIELAREGIFYELGIVFGAVELVPDASIPTPSFAFEVNGIRRAPFPGMPQGSVLVNDTAERVALLLRLEARPALNPANFSQGAAVPAGEAERIALGAGLLTWDPLQYMVLGLARFVRRQADSFVTRNYVEHALSVLWDYQPRLIEAVLGVFSVARLCGVLRGLAAENVSILDLGRVLEALLELGSSREAPGVDVCIAHARERLASQLCAPAGPPEGTLVCALLDLEFEARLAKTDDRPLSSEERERLVDAVAASVAGPVATAKAKVLLVGAGTRSRLRELVRIELPNLTVLGYNEVLTDLNIQTFDSVHLPEPPTSLGIG
jgi:flagellar biosynthesis component FlhA